MKKSLLGVVALALVCAGAAAQEAKGGQEKVAFEKRAFPFEGEVAVERLNVRMFPKADQTSIITSVLGLGEKVTVVAEKEEYFQILPPRGATVWVFGKNVKKEGDKGVVAASDVPVRLDSRVNADVLCSLKEGDAVRIAGEHMGWYKIEAPAAVKYFVGKKYVRAGQPLAPAPSVPGREPAKRIDARIDGDAEARAILAVAESLLDKQYRLIAEHKLDEVDLRDVVDATDNARAKAQSEAVKSDIERAYKRYRDVHVLWESAKSEIARKKADYESKVKEVNTVKAEPKGPLMSGYIDTTGILFKRPGTHKLVMGGKIICFLRVKEGDERMLTRLNDHYTKYVGVNGTLIKNPDGWEGYSVVVVDEVLPLQKE